LLGMLGELYSDQGDVIKAQPVLNEAYHKIRGLADQDQFNIALIYEKIATTQLKIRNYNEAEACYKEAIEITKNVYGDTHHNYYQSIANLCVVYISTNRGTLAVKLLEEQLSRIEEEQGKDNATYNGMMESKAMAHRKLGQDSLEIASRKEIALFYKNKFGEDHLFYFNALGQLSMSQIVTSFSDAEENTRKLEALADKMGIQKTDELYDMIFTLKWYLLNKKEDYSGAVVLAREMASIEESRGDLSGYIGLALSYFAFDQQTEALEAYQKYIDKVLKDVRETFPYLTEDQKIGFYNSEIEYHLDLYYFFALAEPLDLKLRRDSAETSIKREEMKKIRYIKHPNIERIFNYQLITKGLLFEANQKMKQSILQSNDDDLIKLFNEWQLKKSQLNKAFQMSDSKEKEAIKDDLNAEIKILERQMALKSSYFNQLDSKILTWKDVRSKLTEGEAFVEIMAISAGLKLNSNRYKNSGEYLAFVITPETSDFPLCVRLGKGDSLENKYLKNYQNCIRYKITDPLSYDKYWKILADTLTGVNKIYFAPDGI